MLSIKYYWNTNNNWNWNTNNIGIEKYRDRIISKCVRCQLILFGQKYIYQQNHAKCVNKEALFSHFTVTKQLAR